MRLTLQRHYLGADYTLGALFLNGDAFGFTLEDAVRETESGGRWIWTHSMKIPGKTAIPSGQYEITVTWSARFSRPLPLLLRVPDFEAVRIHGGNTTADTEGCPLLGAQQDANGRVWDCAEVSFAEERTLPLDLPTVSENELTRHYTALSKRVHGVNDGFYPLGSCTLFTFTSLIFN